MREKKRMLSRTQIISPYCHRREELTEDMGVRCHHCPKQANVRRIIWKNQEYLEKFGEI